MKTTAKFISLFLCLAMIFSVGLAIIVNAAEVPAPSFSMKVVKTENYDLLYNKVTVTVNLESGSFNALEFKFKTSSGVVLLSVSSPDDAFVCSTSADKSQVAFAGIKAYDKKGTIVTAEFKVFKYLENTIDLDFEVCEVTDSNYNNIAVTPKVISSVKITTTKATSSTSTTKTTTTTTKAKTTTTTARPGTTVIILPPNNQQQSGAVIPDGLTTPDGSLTDVSQSVMDDTSLDYDVYSSEYIDSATQDETKQASAALDDIMGDSHSDNKVIIIVAIIAALIIAGAVTAILIIKKRNKGAANGL